VLLRASVFHINVFNPPSVQVGTVQVNVVLHNDYSVLARCVQYACLLQKWHVNDDVVKTSLFTRNIFKMAR